MFGSKRGLGSIRLISASGLVTSLALEKRRRNEKREERKKNKRKKGKREGLGFDFASAGAN